MKRLESNSCAAARGAPGETSSLPVENTATRTRLTHVDMCQTEGGRERDILRPQSPARGERDDGPTGMSSPAGRTLAPGFRPAGSNHPAARSMRTSSCMNTVSAPSGIGAPVKIRTAWPGAIAVAADAPA